MKQLIALGLTVALIAGVLYFATRQDSTPTEEPEDVVWKVLDMSKAGDVPGYLACFSGELRTKLEATAAEMTTEKFSDYLKESLERVKGVAVFDVERAGETAARLVVEYVYEDKNERQRLTLKYREGAWRIDEAASSEWIQPLIPYGQPVTEIQ